MSNFKCIYIFALNADQKYLVRFRFFAVLKEDELKDPGSKVKNGGHEKGGQEGWRDDL